MQRGRPKHPDVLTPREWEVLALLREGLTNPQIADRLRISENGAKYHVLEIIAKLGVSSRYEAAAWQREPAGASKRYAGLAAIFAWRPPKVASVTTSKVAASTLVIGVFGFLAVLATGVVIMEQRNVDSAESSKPAAVLADRIPTTQIPPTPTPAPPQELLASVPIGPDKLTEMPSHGHELLAEFAVSRGAEYAGVCSSATRGGQICLTAFDGAGDIGHTSILVQVVLMGPQIGYQVVLAPVTPGTYEIANVTGPYPGSAIPPRLLE